MRSADRPSRGAGCPLARALL